MAERLDGRKTLKGLSVLGATALFVASCAAGADVKPPSSFAAIDSPNPNGQSLNTSGVETAMPEVVNKQELSPLEKERQAVLDLWLYNLNSGLRVKTFEDNPDAGEALNVQATNLDGWMNQEAQLDTLLHGEKARETLRISIAGGKYSNVLGTDRGIKFAGQLEIKDVLLFSRGMLPLSDADLANGITAHDKIQVMYLERLRGKYYENIYGKLDAIADFVTQFEEGSYPDFSDWHSTSFDTEGFLRNGEWVVEPLNYASRSISMFSNVAPTSAPFNESEFYGNYIGSPNCSTIEAVTLK